MNNSQFVFLFSPLKISLDFVKFVNYSFIFISQVLFFNVQWVETS